MTSKEKTHGDSEKSSNSLQSGTTANFRSLSNNYQPTVDSQEPIEDPSNSAEVNAKRKQELDAVRTLNSAVHTINSNLENAKTNLQVGKDFNDLKWYNCFNPLELVISAAIQTNCEPDKSTAGYVDLNFVTDRAYEAAYGRSRLGRRPIGKTWLNWDQAISKTRIHRLYNRTPKELNKSYKKASEKRMSENTLKNGKHSGKVKRPFS
jgi:hypothetical protein